MPSSDVNVREQAHKLLRTLCNCLLPIVQGTVGQTTDAKEIAFGIEADEFAIELEKFVTSMISRPRSQDIVIEASLEKLEKVKESRGDNFAGTSRLSKVATPDDKTAVGAVSSGGANTEKVDVNSSAMELAIPQPMPPSSDDKYLQSRLQNLRKYITQTLPIRLLYFEPQNGKLKISLIERAEVYTHFALKLHANRYGLSKWELDNWNLINVHYAILSHTWSQMPAELTYGDWQNGSLDDTHPKCQKLVNFCKAAWQDHGCTLGWIDTVCINKESSAELDESIRSMYKWYSMAKVCITYLAATNMVSNMHADPWFTRGWTLQELVAPRRIKFYNMDWSKLSNATNDKDDSTIQKEIELATTITYEELTFFRLRDDCISISRRMQLAAKREVTREEDIAYCLMGIFRVSISTAYGEGGNHAFFRLVEEIFRSTKDVGDIFNWAGDYVYSSHRPTSLFPFHPSNYLNRQEFHPWRPIEPFTFTHLGLRTPILLMCAVPIQGSVLQTSHQPIGDYHATVSISPFPDRDGFAVAESYHLLDKRSNGPEGLQEDIYRMLQEQRKTWMLIFGILNIEEQGTSVHIPKSCLAILLQSMVELIFMEQAQSFSPGHGRIYTREPIVFPLLKTGNNSDDNSKGYYELERGELAKHGMKLEILYL